MNFDKTVVVGRWHFHFPTSAVAEAARDWAALNSIDFTTFRRRYPDIPYTLPKNAGPVVRSKTVERRNSSI